MRKQVYMTAVAVMAGVLLASGCSKNQDEMPSSSVPQTETATESEASSETETTPAQTEEPAEAGRYHMLQGTVIEEKEDGSAFTLLADDGKEYEISLSDIRDVETEIAEDVQIAIAIGAITAAVIYLWDHCRKFREIVYGIWEACKLVFRKIATVVTSLWANTIKPTFSSIGNFIGGIFNWIGVSIVNSNTF
jgi:outer membrane murein-binding lipoprotein Lpp